MTTLARRSRPCVTGIGTSVQRTPTLTLHHGGGGLGQAGPRGERRIVVALDRSPAGPGALRWAADEAARRGATIEIVSNRLDLAHVSPWQTGVDHRAAAVAERARAVQREIVRTALGEVMPSLRVRMRITEAPLPIAVALAATGADLVVVAEATGWRRRIRQRSLLRWSRRLQCPMVLVPRAARAASAIAPRLRVVPHTA
jgi:hypothetical protein